MINHDITPEEMITIDRYLQGELSPEELVAFRNRMDNEPDLPAKVNEVKLLLLAIAETGVEEQMNQFHKRIPAPAPEARVRSVRLRYFAIAASVIILLSLALWLFLLKGNSRDSLYANYYKPDPGLMTVMGSTDHYDFEKAMVSYRNGEYQQAANSWSSQLVNNPGNDTLCYFLGAAYQAMKKTDSARIYLSKIATQTGSSFYRDANWYMGLLYIQLGQKIEALPYLKLSDRPNADMLIRELEK